MSICLTSLGGSGENGRNCYLFAGGGVRLLLDCGVKREITEKGAGSYPLLTRELAASLDGVFLSHAHEDHVGALPFLKALGYSGPVFGSRETLEEAPQMMRKWASYIKALGGALPFAEKDLDGFDFRQITPGETEIAGLSCLTGRAGHTVGSLWILLRAGGKSALYTGDATDASALLQMDFFPHADAVIMDCAYPGKTLDNAAQKQRLFEKALAAVQSGGKVLLPLPAKGRGSELYLDFIRRASCPPLFVEKSIFKAASALFSQRFWLKPDAVFAFDAKDPRVTAIDGEAARQAALSAPGGAVFMVTDGMLTTKDAVTCLNALKGDARNLALLTGHAAQGTPAAELLTAKGRAALGALMEAEKLTVKVHPDEADALRFLASIQPDKALFFHAEKENCASLLARAAALSVQAKCALSPDGIEV